MLHYWENGKQPLAVDGALSQSGGKIRSYCVQVPGMVHLNKGLSKLGSIQHGH